MQTLIDITEERVRGFCPAAIEVRWVSPEIFEANHKRRIAVAVLADGSRKYIKLNTLGSISYA